MKIEPNAYHGFRFPAEIISHAVWLYHCFSLSLREVETILAQRGIVVSYESIRAWGLRFGRAFANTLKRRRPRPGDKWHVPVHGFETPICAYPAIGIGPICSARTWAGVW